MPALAITDEGRSGETAMAVVERDRGDLVLREKESQGRQAVCSVPRREHHLSLEQRRGSDQSTRSRDNHVEKVVVTVLFGDDRNDCGGVDD